MGGLVCEVSDAKLGSRHRSEPLSRIVATEEEHSLQSGQDVLGDVEEVVEAQGAASLQQLFGRIYELRGEGDMMVG